jgi:hypothetical protein
MDYRVRKINDIESWNNKYLCDLCYLELTDDTIKMEDVRKNCFFCGKKTEIGLSVKCSFCGEIFCQDHYLPNYHNCSDYKSYTSSKKYDDKKLIKKDRIKPVYKIVYAILIMLIVLNVFLFSIKGFELFESFSELNSETQELNNLINTLNSIEYNIENQKSSLSKIDSDIEYYKSIKNYKLHDPTYFEVRNFIANDKTNMKEYSAKEYNCVHYSKDVNNNAELLGIRCAYVEINYPDVGHAIIGFNTTDKGFVYCEPQNDFSVNLEIGKYYYKCYGEKLEVFKILNHESVLSEVKPDYNDTILEIIC